MTPFISCICLQYGDIPQLEDSLGCFLAQDYAGEHEIVILNSFERQKLYFDHPRVRIINLDARPPSLADCRNAAIEHARGQILVTYDSDDAFTPWYLSTVAKHFTGGQWIWLNKQFYFAGWKIRGIVAGSMNSLVFTKDAWRTVGGYRSGLNVGEDIQFVTRITSQTPGKRVDLSPEEIGFLYSWGEMNFHISGQGEDKPGLTTSYERARLNLEKRVAAKMVKVGDITLRPKMKYDYGAMAGHFIAQFSKSTPGNLAVVLLGKYGDCCNSLPILKRLHDRGDRPHVIVSKAFASIFDGVSYVTPVPVDFRFEELLPAMKLAQSKFSRVLRLQVFGSGHVQKRVTSSYNQEPWAEAGMLEDFHNPELRPVFDRRDPVREQGLAAKVFNTSKPKIVTTLLYAASSPFPLGRHVLAAIKLAFRETHEVLDITKLKLHRIYDLLAIIEKAELFISIDTAALHLAAATNTQVVALINNDPWLGSEIRYNDVAVLRYSEATPTRVVEVMREAIGIGRQVAGI